MPECIIFDLDSTLAKSKQPIDGAMAKALLSLLAHTYVAVASGGKFDQLCTQVADQLPSSEFYKKLYFLPTSGAELYEYSNNSWNSVYKETLTQQEALHITQAIHKANDKTSTVDFSQTAYGERIEFRGSQVSFSALGQEAPLEKKKEWDTDHAKREALRAVLVPLLPDYEVRIGGTTTIDITKKGIDKAYGVKKLSAHLMLSISHMLYVGDELRTGGNDEVVIATGIPTHEVTSPKDTEQFIVSLLGNT